MYLVSLFEEESVVEASLGGRVTVDEIFVFGEELLELIEEFEHRPFTLILDHSRARRFDVEAINAFGLVKDRCLAAGATEIVCAPVDEQDQAAHETNRIQAVLEGRESYVSDVNVARYKRASIEVQRRAA